MIASAETHSIPFQLQLPRKFIWLLTTVYSSIPKDYATPKTSLDIKFVAKLYGAFVTPKDYDGNALLDIVVPMTLQNVYLFHILVAHSCLMHLMTGGNSATANKTLQ